MALTPGDVPRVKKNKQLDNFESPPLSAREETVQGVTGVSRGRACLQACRSLRRAVEAALAVSSSTDMTCKRDVHAAHAPP
jgi:hypothetical protein